MEPNPERRDARREQQIDLAPGFGRLDHRNAHGAAIRARGRVQDRGSVTQRRLRDNLFFGAADFPRRPGTRAVNLKPTY